MGSGPAMTLVRGQKTRLSDLTGSSTIEVGLAFATPGGIEIDCACFAVDASERLSDDRYFVFYNQPSSPEQAIRKLGPADGDLDRFELNFARMPAFISKLVFTATIDGSGVMSDIPRGHLRLLAGSVEVARFAFTGSDFAGEKALIVGEFYLKDIWRFAAVGQGFNGGLSALLAHFGGEEAASPTPAPAPVKESKRIVLEKQVEAKAPQLLSLVKKAGVSLEKAGLHEHRARVALCLDVSGSMFPLYRAGKVQELAERVLALGCHFDDNGGIDVFLFGTDAKFAGEMTLTNWSGCVDRLMATPERRAAGGGTEYWRAIQVIRDYYFPGATKTTRSSPISADLPVYVMFITDGDTGNKKGTKDQIVQASFEPIFWQFMAIGQERFSFLHELDTLPKRFVDNANFFAVPDPSRATDEEIYRQMMVEYPGWVKLAGAQGLLTAR